jgi:endonuclease/exonuclease/phosphatase family metal-dependent hydrolase
MNNIYCLTYNISWATQINKVAGSEDDFVMACQQAYSKGGLQCITNALKNLSRLPYKFDIIALQEVNSDIEERFMKIYPNLTKFVKSKLGLETSSIIWNENKLGILYKSFPLDLGSKEDNRSCTCIVLLKDDIYNILITLHAPNPFNNNLVKKSKLAELIKTKLKKYILKPTTRIIILGDFNDFQATITDTNKLIFNLDNKNKLVLTSGFSRDYHLQKLKSCCWHNNHKASWGHFINNGDLIIANKNCKIHKLFIPKSFDYIKHNKLLYSDHKPVVAEIELLNYNHNNNNIIKTKKHTILNKYKKTKKYK